MKYTIIKFFRGDFEITCSDKKITLTDENPAIVVNEDEYKIISEMYESMIVHGMILVQRIEPKIEIKQEAKKFNK